MIKSAEPERVRRAVEAHAARLRGRHPEIEQILWFGSRARGTPTPGSDVDLCILLTHSNVPPRERIAEFLPFGFPVGIDLFPYTREEFRRIRETSPAWYRTITSGIEV